MLEIKELTINGSEISFGTPENQGIVIRLINDSVVNVRSIAAEDTIATRAMKRNEVKFELTETNAHYMVRTERLTVKVHKENLLITFLNSEGKIINEDHEKNLQAEEPASCYKVLKENEQIFGCGEQAGFINHRGKKVKFWNYAEPKHFNLTSNEMYQSIPFYISKEDETVYGLFYDNSFRSSFDFGVESEEYISISADGGELNYYFIYGDSIKEILQLYTDLTGKSPMPPLWSLGYHQSRWSYFPDNRVYEVANSFREKNIPCDSIHLDIDYMDNYKIFSFNKDRFPDPKKMFTELNDIGFKMIAIVDPGVKREAGYDVYEQGLEHGYFCKEPNGEDFIGDVWPGGCAFPDFTNSEVRKWWSGLNKEFLNLGIRGIWNDLNEPSILVEPHTMSNEVIHRTEEGDKSHAEIHNLYANYEAMATWSGWEEYDSHVRPFILSRAGFAGIQKYAAVWTGDNTSSWDALLISIPMFINLGLSGIPFVGADVGGYAGDCSEELLIRWTQLGAFTPLFRNHSRKEVRDQEPWAYSEKGEEIMRKFIQLRYKLIPYLYTAYRETHEKGYPLLRPMLFNFENDKNTHGISDQFMIGDQLIIAPIYIPGQDYRAVYLPEGQWYDYWSNELYQGGQYIVANASLDSMPIFVKSGAVIPEYPVMNYVAEKEVNELTLNVYFGDGKYVYYEDNGTDKDYLNGKFNKTLIAAKKRVDGYTINISSQFKGYDSTITTYRLLLNGFNSVSCITVNGKEVPFTQSEKVEFKVLAENEIEIKINE